MKITNKELIQKAKSVVKPKKMRHGFTSSDVGGALLTDKGNIFLGVSIDVSSGMGFCAEHSAIAKMVTNQEFKIIKIAAVSKDGTVLPPCGRCREFMYQIDRDNLDTDVIVKKDKVVKLRDLLPFRWDEKL